MSGQRTRTIRSRQGLDERAAPGAVSETAVGHSRLRAKITANNGDGTYAVTTFAASGTAIDTALLVLAFPAVTTLAVDTYCWVDFLPGSTRGMIDATASAIGGGGSGSLGDIIVVGAPGFLSGT